MKSITLFEDSTKEKIVFSDTNLFFGYAKSGKTSIFEKLVSIFSGKEKSWTSNSAHIRPGDFSIISIGPDETIGSHLKLTSKSLLRKALEKAKYSDQFWEQSNQLSKSLSSIREELENSIKTVMPSAKVSIASSTEPVDLLLDNMSISINDDSGSSSRQYLFNIANEIGKESNVPTLIFADDFTYGLDEEMIYDYFSSLQPNCYYFLSSKTPIPQSLLTDDKSIFAVRDSKLISILPVLQMIKNSLEEQPSNTSFEEYMLNDGYKEASGEIKDIEDAILYDERSQFLRILTAKDPTISSVYEQGKVSIVPRNKNELVFYEQLFKTLGIKSK